MRGSIASTSAWRGVGDGRRGAADGVRQPEPRVRVGGRVHPQPARALQPPGAAVRRLRGAQPGRRPGRRSRLPAARLRGAAPGQPDLTGCRTLPRARLSGATAGCSRSRASWSASATTTPRRSSSPSSRRRPTTSSSCRSAPWCRSRPEKRPTLTPRRRTTARRSPWARASPAAPTRGGWRSTPGRSRSCWPNRRGTTSCCCAPTRCPRTSPSSRGSTPSSRRAAGPHRTRPSRPNGWARRPWSTAATSRSTSATAWRASPAASCTPATGCRSTGAPATSSRAASRRWPSPAGAAYRD